MTPLIEILGEHKNTKASERYIEVAFHYPDERNAEWRGSVPIEYRRTGIYAKSEEEVSELLDKAYEAMRPSLAKVWLEEQEQFWARKNAPVTSLFFEALKDCTWKCRNCDLPPNPNFARRIQDIKELGYTLATYLNRACSRCNENTTHIILLRLPRATGTGYETISQSLRKRIISTLHNYDAYEHARRSSHLLPDHKFPEIRWGLSAPSKNPDDMSNSEIKEKFQLLTNQRNQQKREICRQCYQTGKRGTPFGIRFFYKGNGVWPKGTPKRGQETEKGCIGCGWYDLKAWRDALNAFLSSGYSED